MELVYLWIENYKNIEQQGFNLSPKFECSYNKETKELVVNEKDLYKSIFPEDINITIIVGENGSGKSSLLNCIQVSQKIFIVVLDEELQVYTSNIIIHTSLVQKRLTNDFQRNILYYAMDNKYLRETNRSVNHIILENTNRLITQNYNKLLTLDFNLFNFKPYHIYYDLEDFKFIDYNFELTDEGIESIKSSLGRDYEVETNDILTVVEDLKKIDDEYFNYLLSYFYDIFSFIENTDILERIHPKHNYLIFEKEDLIEILNNNNEHFLPEDIFNLLMENKHQKIEIDKLETIFGEDYNEILFHHSILYELEMNYFSENGASFNSLSHGEKTIYSFFLHLLNTNKSEILLFLDEPDNTLHPNWQKRFLKELIELTQSLNKKAHIIITTHSPFLLSDIPKDNVIYLEKDHNTGLCIDVSNNLDLKSFGANIHTLLSHGFFMKDGFMGSFAKEKIDELLEYLNGNLETIIEDNNEAQYRINMIGEPIIQKQLQKMLDSKRLTKVDKIDLIEAQIKELSIELEQLKDG